jgi:hypothetical protein
VKDTALKIGKIFVPVKKKVRFQETKKPWASFLVGFLVRFFRPGCQTINRWKWVVVLATTLDFFTLPLMLIGYLIQKDKSSVSTSDIHAELSGHHSNFLYAEILIDVVFILDEWVMTALAVVRDLGFQDLIVDKLVKAIPEAEGEPLSDSKDLTDAHRALESNGSLLGPDTRMQIMYVWPKKLLLMAPLWVVSAMQGPVWARSIACTLRFYRIWAILRYLNERQADVTSPMRTFALFKFAFIVFGTGHWIGCIFFFVAAAQKFKVEGWNMNWVDILVRHTHVDYDWRTASIWHTYLVCCSLKC